MAHTRLNALTQLRNFGAAEVPYKDTHDFNISNVQQAIDKALNFKKTIDASKIPYTIDDDQNITNVEEGLDKLFELESDLRDWVGDLDDAVGDLDISLGELDERVEDLEGFRDEQKTFPQADATTNLIFTTDDLADHGSQTLSTLIERRLQDTKHVVTNTFQIVNIFIRAGTSTTAALRIHGLDMPTANVDVYIDPGVTLASIQMENNRTRRLNVFNCGNINGNVIINNNQTTGGSIDYNQNFAATAAPVYPIGHPLAGQAVPIARSLVTGGITMMQNDSAVTVICRIGQHCEVGVVDVHGMVNNGVAPAVGTTAPGVININYNKARYDAICLIYCSYINTGTIPPGPLITSTIWLYHNLVGRDAYIHVQAGWRDGAQPTIQNAQVRNNICGRNAWVNIGNSSAATTFAGTFTATAQADTSTASRSTITLTTALTAQQAAVVLGMGCTFTNASSGSSANNFTGIFRRVTAYNATTRVITLESAWTNPRPGTQTVTFFPWAGQTQIWYGTNVYIEAMLQTALAGGTNTPVGLINLDGANAGTAYRVTAVDTTNKVVTITPGLAANGTTTSTFTPVGSFAPRTVGDYSITFQKIAANQYRSTADVRFHHRTNVDAVNCRITGGLLGAGVSRRVATAAWGGAGFENRIILTFDSDDTGAIVSDNVVYTYVIRRMPGHGLYQVTSNSACGGCYSIMGSYGNGRNGALRIRSISVTSNQAIGAVYVDTLQFVGPAVNQNGALKVDFIDVGSNHSCSNVYITCRSNRSTGGGNGGVVRLRLFSNYAGGDGFITIGSHTTVQRTVEMFHNSSGRRWYIDCALPGGVTISATTAPLIRSNVQIYRNTTSQVWCNRIAVTLAALNETGLAPRTNCLEFTENHARTWIASASNWLNCSVNTAANVAAVLVTSHDGFEWRFAVPCTIAGSQTYALRLSDVRNVIITVLPGTSNRVQMIGYTHAHLLSTLALTSIFNASHANARDANTSIIRNGVMVTAF